MLYRRVIRRLGILKQYSSNVMLAQRLMDPLIAAGILFFLVNIRGESFNMSYVVLSIITVLLVLIVFDAFQIYRSWRGLSLAVEIRSIFAAWLVVLSVLLLFGYITKTSIYFSRFLLLFWCVSTPTLYVISRVGVRLLLRWIRRKGKNARSVVIVGAGNLGKRLYDRILHSPSTGMRVVGFFDDKNSSELSSVDNVPIIGTLDDVVDYCKGKNIDRAYFTLPLRAEFRMREVVLRLQDTNTFVYIVPDIFAFELLQTRIESVEDMPVLSITDTPMRGVAGIVKRVEDVLLLIVSIPIVLPLIAIVSVFIKVTSSGPVFFRQRRCGLNGEEFLVYKFRTMTVCEDGMEVAQAKKADSRVTRLGRLLRKTSLDELPQFLNVLKGNMSIVGPRPHAVAHNEYYRSRIQGYMLRHRVKPGITGLAQVNGWRGETETIDKMEKRIEHDLSYIRSWSPWLDLFIIMKTMKNGFFDKNAY